MFFMHAGKQSKLWQLCCFHKHITHFWENKYATLNQNGFLQKKSELENMDF